MEEKKETEFVRNRYMTNNKDLIVICPTRNRPELAKRMLDSYNATHRALGCMVFYIADDDPKLDEYKRILDNNCYVVGRRRTIIEVFNFIACELFPGYKFYGEVNDDHIYRTVAWDDTFIKRITVDGHGWGIAYGNDLINGEKLPGALMISGNLVRAMGYMALPTLVHTYIDNFWGTVGTAINRLFYCPDVTIEHCHVWVNKAKMDENYEYAYDKERNKKSAAAFEQWVNNNRAADIRKIMLAMIKDVLGDNPMPTIGLCMMIADSEPIDRLLKGLDPLVGWVDEMNFFVNYQHFPLNHRFNRIQDAIRKRVGYMPDSPEMNFEYGKWPDDFSKARNYNLDMAHSDFIYWQDADDIPLMPHLMLDYIVSNPGYDFFKCKVFSLTERGSAELIWSNRLFKNKPEYKFRNSCHEDISFSQIEAGAKCVLTNISIQHTGNITWKAVQRKNKRNFRLIARDMKNNPHSLTYYNMVNSLLLMGGDKNARKCIRLLDEALAKFEYRDDDPILPKFWVIRGACCLRCGQIDAAKQSFHKAWDVSKNPEAACYLGEIYIKEKNLDKAIEIMTAIYSQGQYAVLNIPFDVRAVHLLLLQYLGDAWAMKGDLKKAEAYYHEYLKNDPDNLMINDRMIQLLMQTRRIDAAGAKLVNMVNKYPKYFVGWNLLGQYELMSNRPVTARMFFRTAVAVNPRFQEALVNLRGVEAQMKARNA